MSSRDDVGITTCRRFMVLGAGSIITDVNVSRAACMQSQAALYSIISVAGKEAAKILKLKKTKTVNLEIIKACFLSRCMGINEASLVSAPRKGKGQRGVPMTGIVRLFRKELGASDIISNEAKKAIVGAAEAYLKTIGKNACLMTSAAKRKTIQEADVVAARQLAF